MRSTVTLFYQDDELVGRALTEEEYANISEEELRDAISHSLFASEIGCEENEDLRGKRDFYELSVEQFKERLKKYGLIILRSNEPLHRNEFPPYTKGPRKGMSNFTKEPIVYQDRIYQIEYENNLTKVESVVEVDENGNFTVLEEAVV